MTVPYLDTPAGWDKVVSVIRAAGVCGWDSETYGHEVDESTPVGRARVHVWSLAVPTSAISARGHRVAAGVVLPGEALGYTPLKQLLQDPNIPKWAWNAPHDVHSAREHDVEVRGWIDGLPLARVALPHLQRHGLKTVGPYLTGKQMSSFEDVCSMDVEVYLDTRVCSCQPTTECDFRPGTRGRGMLGAEEIRPVWRGERCPRRGRSKDHRSLPAWTTRSEKQLQPLNSITPGHPLWSRLLEYSAEDAVIALECGELLNGSQLQPIRPPPLPWFPPSPSP